MPLGLKNTWMVSGQDLTGNYSHGYTYDLGNGLQDITRQEVGSWGWTAGGLISDMTDMIICAEAFAEGKLLSQEMNDEFMNWRPLSVTPGTPQDSFSGLGIAKYKELVGNSVGTYGYTSWMWSLPSKKATIVAFFNQTSTFSEDREANEQALLAELLIGITGVFQ